MYIKYRAQLTKIIYTVIQYIYFKDSNRLFVLIKKGQNDISSKPAALSC
jgi:hypothetical protein